MGDGCWGDRLEIMTHGNGDRIWEMDCWGDRLDIANYDDGDRLFVIFSIKFNNVFSGNE
ncbi:hypothetical protein VB774_23335 [Pseudanabaena galeata UHCC 0370]|uniref:Uncharacterized protein n=1 Tax=Pseudanabaena galeata UHCC 0370 TaxID=3110310 RepID=A0ABU5TQG1_9CYAN|nr:hypothetical protein [Pseudanabaena galeata]MEA5480580.1 hypothetical protein [Pseudanabaena galeata UHCC 0370]